MEERRILRRAGEQAVHSLEPPIPPRLLSESLSLGGGRAHGGEGPGLELDVPLCELNFWDMNALCCE